MGHADMIEFPVFWQYGTTQQQIRDFGNHTYNDMKDYWLNGRAYTHSYACNKIYRRSLFDEIRFPVRRVFEDAATLPLLLDKAGTVKTTEKGLYYYCANEKGITATADGQQLAMLLDAHLQVISRWCDEVYYMHVLNLQMDVCELTGALPQLPVKHISPLSSRLNTTFRLKAAVLNLLGLQRLCKLNTIIHKAWGRRS
jgi:hypothetical protein